MVNHTRLVMAAIVLVALAVRLGAVAATPHLHLADDPRDYDRHARSIAAGHGYPKSQIDLSGGPTAIRPPAFPFLLAGVYKLTGNSVTAGRIAQAVLGAIAVALIAVIALQFWGPLVAMVVAALAAVFPPLVLDGMTLLSEPLFVVFELASLAAILHWRQTRGVGWLAASGALAGLALLTRANGALLVLPLCIAALGAGGWRRLVNYRRAALVLLCTVLVVLPWTIRNAVELHTFIPVTDQDGYTLIGTYNATSERLDGRWLVGELDPHVHQLVERNRKLDEPGLDAVLRTDARRFALHHLSYLPNVALHNSLRMFNLAGPSFERDVAQFDFGLGLGWARLMTYGFLPVLALAVVGAFTRAARRAPAWFWLVPVLLLTPVMILTTNRTRAPIDPFLLLLAALGLISLSRRIAALRVRPE